MNITRSVLICSLALGLSFSSVGRADNTPAYLTKADIKSLKVDEINLGKGARMFELSVSYNFSNDIRQAKLSCASLKACTVLHKEILSALSAGKKLALNFNSDQVVASIVEVKPAPPSVPPAAAAEVACEESSTILARARKVAINFSLLKDLTVPNSAGKVQISNECWANLREAVAQPRLIKARDIIGNIGHAEESHGGCEHNMWTYNGSEVLDATRIVINTPFDKTIQSFECVFSKKGNVNYGRQLGDIKKVLESELIESGIGKAEACSKPVEAKVLTDYRDMSEALSLLGDKSSAGRNSSEADDAIGQKAVPSAESDVPTSIRQEKQEASAQTVI